MLTGAVRHSIRAWMKADGVEPSSLTRVLKAWLGRDAEPGSPIHRLETGELAPARFDSLLAAELTTTHGGPVDPAGLLQRIFAEMRPEPEMFGLAEELRGLGVRVGLLSNSWGNTYPRSRVESLLDPVVISGEVGLRKPDRAIYDFAVERLGLPANRVLFLDDVEVNVLGARSAGLQSLVHVDAGATRTALAALIPDLTPARTGVLA